MCGGVLVQAQPCGLRLLGKPQCLAHLGRGRVRVRVRVIGCALGASRVRVRVVVVVVVRVRARARARLRVLGGRRAARVGEEHDGAAELRVGEHGG